METIIAFFAGLFLSWPTLIILCIFGILSEHNNSRGWAIFWTLLILPICYFFFDLTFTTFVIYTAIYTGAGFVWSFFRYTRYITVESSKIRNSGDSDDVKQRRALNLHPKNNIDTITAWVIVWPFSAVENFAGDLINGIEILVSKVFKGVYYSIYNKIVGDLIKDPTEKE